MAYLARDKDGTLAVFDAMPEWSKNWNVWYCPTATDNVVGLPDDADEKLIGRQLTWEDEPVEI